jgi:cytochrome P450
MGCDKLRQTSKDCLACLCLSVRPPTKITHTHIRARSHCQVYTEACFREALRLNPPVGAVSRDVAVDTTLKGGPRVCVHACMHARVRVRLFVCWGCLSHQWWPA